MKRALQVVGALSLLFGIGLLAVPWHYQEFASPLNPDLWIYLWAQALFHIVLGGGLVYLSFRPRQRNGGARSP